MSYNDAIKLFNLSNDYDLIELKKTYYKLARKYHPDFNGESVEEIMKKVNEAYEILKGEASPSKNKTQFKFTEEEINIIKDYAKKLDSEIRDLFYEYNIEQKQGFTGSFIDYLDNKLKRKQKLDSMMPIIEEYLKKLGYTLSIDFYIEAYTNDKQNGFNGDFIYWLKSKLEEKELCNKLNHTVKQMRESFTTSNYDGSYIEYLKELVSIEDYCNILGLSKFELFNQYKLDVSFGYSNTFKSWLEQKATIKQSNMSESEIINILYQKYQQEEGTFTDFLNSISVKDKEKTKKN